MALINSDIPNLLNGVSQQPATLRLTSQGENQVNGYSSIVDGLVKRLGSEHKFKLSATPASATAYVHWINRDADNRYVVVVESDNTLVGTSLDIYDHDTGLAVTVTVIIK